MMKELIGCWTLWRNTEMTKEIIIEGTAIKQPTRSLFIGACCGADLIGVTDHDAEYARMVDKGHVIKIQQKMLLDKTMPTIPQLAYRNGLGRQIIIDKYGLHVPRGEKLKVVDGNHNITALRQISSANKEFLSIKYPVLIDLGTSEQGERLQFLEHNTKAKKMDSAHSFRERQKLLTSNGEEYMRARKLYDPLLKTPVIEVIELLNSSERSPLCKMILHPNRYTTSGIMLTERSLIRALGGYMLSPTNVGRSGKDIGAELITFLSIIRDLVKQAFKEPKRWLIVRPGGIMALTDFYLLVKKMSRGELSTVKLLDLLTKMPAFKKPERYWLSTKKSEYAGLTGSAEGAAIIRQSLLEQFNKVYL